MSESSEGAPAASTAEDQEASPGEASSGEETSGAGLAGATTGRPGRSSRICDRSCRA